MLYIQGLFVPFARIGSGDPVRVLCLFHNEYTGYNYNMCDIYREFGDAVYVTVPATAICSMQLCAVPFEFLLVGRQTSRESGEIPPDRRPVRVCMMDKMDQLKSESGQPWRSLLKEDILNFPGNQFSSINH